MPSGSRLCAIVFLFAVVGTTPSATLAQEAPAGQGSAALVLPASAERDLAEAREWVSALVRALEAEGVTTMSVEDASTTFEARVSSPAVALSASDIERWVARSQSAVRHLARADYDRARADLLEAHALSSGAAEELNREAERARQVLDTCLYMVRAYVETRDDANAMNQARACRQLVPGAEPSPYRHTPEVREIIARVDANIAAEAPGQLVVTSEPSGCAVRLNGISFGTTPFRMDGIAAGEYRLQVECDEVERGRIRRIRVGAGETAVHVDGAFDHAIRSRPALGLLYDSPELARARAGVHANQLNGALGTSEVWLLWLVAPGRLRVDRVSAEGVHSAWLAVNVARHADADAALLSAVQHLRARRSVDLEHPETPVSVALELPGVAEAEAGDVADEEREEVEQARPPGEVSERRRVMALSITSGVSAAALLTATALHIARIQRGETWLSGWTPQRANAWVDLRLPTTLIAAGGGLLATATLPVLLPQRQGVPAGAWVAGALGVGLAGATIGTTLRRPGCRSFAETQGACIEREQLGDRAVIFASAAAPLLTVPLIYALRPAHVSPEVAISPNGAWVSVSGAF